MPEMENLNEMLLLSNPVEDLERRVRETPDTRMPFHRYSNVGKSAKKVDVVKQRLCESLACLRMFFPRPSHDFGEIG